MSDVLTIPIPRGAYPERELPPLSWLDDTGERASGVLLRRLGMLRARPGRLIEAVSALEKEMEGLSDLGLRQRAAGLRLPLRREGFGDVRVARAFALVREAARRTIGQRHYDVQLHGGSVLLRGMVAEMETGEGKTLAATLPAATAALAGIPVHIVTVNDYLVGRDSQAMAPVFGALGLSVGAIRQGMSPGERRAQYACDVTYCSNKELVFDYLKDRLALGRQRSRVRLQLDELRSGSSGADRLLLRGLCYAIVDEADSVLIDEARTPLIISGPGDQDGLEHEVYRTAMALAGELVESADFRVDLRERRVRVNPQGEARLAKLARNLGGIWSGRQRRESLVSQALTAVHLYRRDEHYLVEDGRVRIIDEYTGRVMRDRSWERGLHQMIEVKEGLETTRQVEPLARMSYQRFFRRYLRLAGMTGTAREVSRELWSVYRLPVVPIPTNRPLRRELLGDRVFRSADEKWDAVVLRIREIHAAGRPILVGTRSVAESERLSARLDELGLEHRVLNARQDGAEAEVIAQAGQGSRITVATNMAGRGTDIVLSAEAEAAGGLHVIATERHEAQRIDRQLIGRGARQGDPGTCEIVTSLEDELVRSHGWPLWSNGPGAELAATRGPSSRLRRMIVRQAQARAERLHSKARRDLVKLDERIETMLAFTGKGE